ncbi:2,3-bisphosphoglycerate-dependent phosphoglycerate mutase [Folsomia candida]|uniref:2,3-bisphosphoglycerate-dependent phosphoglycerate mutase n=1 Tax=Folsomia candida TaxID=158441 RepID=UPI000B8F818D|nr:2,3-bisphosphoglycerate-dependent phosphoglycerate mutase [Folsomia candida]
MATTGVHQHTIYFVRHGQCRGNVTGETLTPDQDVITDFGRKQADALGNHLKSVEFTQAYASNYQRAIETAKCVLDKCDEPCTSLLKMDSRIRERDLGELVGLPTKEIIKKTIAKLAEGQKFNSIEIPGGESVAEYVGRQESFFKELFDSLKSSSKPERVLVVSHGLLIRRFLVGLNDGSFPDLCVVSNWEKKCGSVVENTCCTIFNLEFPSGNEKPVLTFEKIHDKEHLKQLKADNNNAEVDHAANKSTFNVSHEEKVKFFGEVMKIPGAKEELSGCVQV